VRCTSIAPVAPATNTLIVDSFNRGLRYSYRQRSTFGCDTPEHLWGEKTRSAAFGDDCQTFSFRRGPAGRAGRRPDVGWGVPGRPVRRNRGLVIVRPRPDAVDVEAASIAGHRDPFGSSRAANDHRGESGRPRVPEPDRVLAPPRGPRCSGPRASCPESASWPTRTERHGGSRRPVRPDRRRLCERHTAIAERAAQSRHLARSGMVAGGMPGARDRAAPPRLAHPAEKAAAAFSDDFVSPRISRPMPE
jgi:hypothetical protein